MEHFVVAEMSSAKGRACADVVAKIDLFDEDDECDSGAHCLSSAFSD